MSGLRAVFFDVGNTLLYPSPSVSEVVREVLGSEGHTRDLSAIDSLMPLVDEYYEDRYREDDTFWRSEEETSAVWVGMYSLLCRKLEVDADAERIARRVYDEFGSSSRWAAYADVRPTIEMLRGMGLVVGVISNWDTRLAGLLDGLSLSSLVDVMVCSADVGLHKPDPRIFELACERAGVGTAEAAHVGDHVYADVLGAQTVGMTPVLIDRHDGPHPGTQDFIRSLDELFDVLGLERGC